ncbi:protein mono-ADP-ribosyltransferase PARP16-like [Oratosquilla oratoria]|uniref:protein mono-ADP-ribosyltransferase PARP16-like n=1 Tax=Oratosquilla oratoria TaxID=337810 RepID=UPI003F773704
MLEDGGAEVGRNSGYQEDSSQDPTCEVGSNHRHALQAATEAENWDESAITEETQITLVEKLRADPRPADLLVSILAAAAGSYRYDSVLRPFPPMGTSRDMKDINKLRTVLGSLCGVEEFQTLLNQERNSGSKKDAADLLVWTMTSANFDLKFLPIEKFQVLSSLAGMVVPVPTPSHVVELCWHPTPENRFRQVRGLRPTMFAFHGSRLDNFHSILHHGLQQHMNKTSLFGKGIYLSSEMSVSLPYSPAGQGWVNSSLGPSMSVIALCELVDHPDVKCQTRDDQNRAYTGDMFGGAVPDKYFVVVNSDLVRIRYLLIYCSPNTNSPRRGSSVVLRYIANHKMLMLLCAYVMVIIGIGLSNQPGFNRLLRRWLPFLYKRNLDDI